MVAILHLSYGRAPENASAIALVERMREISAEFSGWWEEYRLCRFIPIEAVLRHPEFEELRIALSSFVESAARDTEPVIILL
jgi:hypothetical protein